MGVLMGMQGLSAAAELREDPKAKTLFLLALVDRTSGLYFIQGKAVLPE